MAVIEIIRESGVPYAEKDFSETELLNADEVFITSTTAEILPVVSINGSKIGGGLPGEITKRLYQKFQERISKL